MEGVAEDSVILKIYSEAAETHEQHSGQQTELYTWSDNSALKMCTWY